MCLSLSAGPFPEIFVPDPCHDVIDIRTRGLFFSCHKETGAANEALSSDIVALSLVLSAFFMAVYAGTRPNGINWPASKESPLISSHSRRCIDTL